MNRFNCAMIREAGGRKRCSNRILAIKFVNTRRSKELSVENCNLDNRAQFFLFVFSFFLFAIELIFR